MNKKLTILFLLLALGISVNAQLPSGVTFANYQLNTTQTEAINVLPTSWTNVGSSSSDIENFDANYQNYASLPYVFNPSTQGWSSQTALIASLYTTEAGATGDPDIESYKNTISGLTIGTTYTYSIEAAYNNLGPVSGAPQGRVPYLEVTFGGVSGGVYQLTSTAIVYEFTFTATSTSTEVIINDNITNNPEYTGGSSPANYETNPQVMVLAGSGKFMEQDPCAQLVNAPSIERNYAIPCDGSTTVDLSGLTAYDQPSGSEMSIHTGTPATSANEVSDITTVPAGNYYAAFKANDGTNDCYSPTLEIKVIEGDCAPRCSNITEEQATHTAGGSGAQSGTVSTLSVGGGTYTITRDAINGYSGSNYSIDTEGGVKIANPFQSGGNDSYTFTYSVVPDNNNVIPKIRFYQTRGQSAGNNEASKYTITWTGGTGNAVFYDPITPGCNMYEASYGNGCPSGFDNNNREIVGLSTTGGIPNGGSFDVYQVKNNGTQWYVELPDGATSVTVTKVVYAGGTIGPGCGAQPNNNISCGVDSQWPFYGLNQTAPGTPGESYQDWLSFNTKFVAPQCGSISGNVSEDTAGDDNGDTALPGVELTLLDNSGNPVLDQNSNPYTAVTDQNGDYTFFNVPPGAGYQVVETDPSGYTSVSDTEGGNDNIVRSIDVVVGQDNGGNNFVDKKEVINTTQAENDINQTPIDTPVDGNILTNDTDAEGNGQTVQSATYLDASGNEQPLTLGVDTPIYDENGVLAGNIALATDGTYTFTPATGYTGTVPVNYVVVDDNTDNPVTDNTTLTIEVLPTPTGDNPPVAQDDTATVEQGDTVTSTLLANDSHVDGETLTVVAGSVTGLDATGSPVVLTSIPQDIYDTNGVLAGQASVNETTGEVAFVADTNFVGDVPVEYTVIDQDADGNNDANGNDTDGAKLIITVESEDNINETYANDDANTNYVNKTQTGNVLVNDNDPEGDAQTVSQVDTDGDGTPDGAAGTMVTLPSGGTVVINTDGTYIYTPETDFVGTEQVVYEVIDVNGNTALATLYLTTLPKAVCTLPALSGQPEVTRIGVSTLDRNVEDWMPEDIGGYIALESDTKPFVVTRMADPATSINTPVEGMVVWDTDDYCLKLYDGTQWKCMTQGCNQ